jgi:hypothetical protein
MITLLRMLLGGIAIAIGAAAAAAQSATGAHDHGPPPAATSVGTLSLTTLRSAGFVEVTIDPARFRQERVATIRIVNALGIPVSGEIPACTTVFEPADTRLTAIAPAESGPFVVGPRQTIQLTRPFRALDPSKRPAEGSSYRLSVSPLDRDLADCPED